MAIGVVGRWRGCSQFRFETSLVDGAKHACVNVTASWWFRTCWTGPVRSRHVWHWRLSLSLIYQHSNTGSLIFDSIWPIFVAAFKLRMESYRIHMESDSDSTFYHILTRIRIQIRMLSNTMQNGYLEFRYGFGYLLNLEYSYICLFCSLLTYFEGIAKSLYNKD